MTSGTPRINSPAGTFWYKMLTDINELIILCSTFCSTTCTRMFVFIPGDILSPNVPGTGGLSPRGHFWQNRVPKWSLPPPCPRGQGKGTKGRGDKGGGTGDRGQRGGQGDR